MPVPKKEKANKLIKEINELSKSLKEYQNKLEERKKEYKLDNIPSPKKSLICFKECLSSYIKMVNEFEKQLAEKNILINTDPLEKAKESAEKCKNKISEFENKRFSLKYGGKQGTVLTIKLCNDVLDKLENAKKDLSKDEITTDNIKYAEEIIKDYTKILNNSRKLLPGNENLKEYKEYRKELDELTKSINSNLVTLSLQLKRFKEKAPKDSSLVSAIVANITSISNQQIADTLTDKLLDGVIGLVTNIITPIANFGIESAKNAINYLLGN